MILWTFFIKRLSLINTVFEFSLYSRERSYIQSRYPRNRCVNYDLYALNVVRPHHLKDPFLSAWSYQVIERRRRFEDLSWFQRKVTKFIVSFVVVQNAVKSALLSDKTGIWKSKRIEFADPVFPHLSNPFRKSTSPVLCFCQQLAFCLKGFFPLIDLIFRVGKLQSLDLFSELHNFGFLEADLLTEFVVLFLHEIQLCIQFLVNQHSVIPYPSRYYSFLFLQHYLVLFLHF